MFKDILASAAIAAIAALSVGTNSVNALVAGHHDQIGHVARHLGTSSVNHAVIHRKRNAHRQRRACIQHPVGDTPGPAPSPPALPSNPPPQSNTGYAGRGKIGLAWGPDVDRGWIPNMVQASGYRVGYVYNWSPWPFPPEVLAGSKFALMVWGWHHVGDFEQNVRPGLTDVILGPNEVNQSGQAQMSEDSAAELWNNHIGPKRDWGYRLGSPCTTNAPGGLEWIANWLPKVWVQPDFITIHWYGVDFEDFKNYLTRAHQMFNKPIWVTEYACTDFSYQRGCDVFWFTRQATDWMDQQWWIESYFQFGFVNNLHGVSEQNRLVNLYNGQPSDLGWTFLQ